MLNFLKKLDMFGYTQRVTHNGKDFHPTKFGGFMTIL